MNKANEHNNFSDFYSKFKLIFTQDNSCSDFIPSNVSGVFNCIEELNNLKKLCEIHKTNSFQVNVLSASPISVIELAVIPIFLFSKPV